jgi:dienelactone hydrolase
VGGALEGRPPLRFEKHGSGPGLVLGPPVRTSRADALDPQGRSKAIRDEYLKQLADRYTVVLLDLPPVAPEALKEAVPALTADTACADILAVADAAGLDRFAYAGFSFGAGVGVQLAARTERLAALLCGSWSPLGMGQSEAVARIACPRQVVVGDNDIVTVNGGTTRLTDLVRRQREELGNLGWEMRIVPGFGHELGSAAETAAPIVRQFLDRVL